MYKGLSKTGIFVTEGMKGASKNLYICVTSLMNNLETKVNGCGISKIIRFCFLDSTWNCLQQTLLMMDVSFEKCQIRFILVTLGCGGKSSQNCTYFESSTAPGAGACGITICECSTDICQVSLPHNSTDNCRVSLRS